LILIPTEVFLKVKEGGAALTSSVTKIEKEKERNQSMYEQLDVPDIDTHHFEDHQKTSELIPDLHFTNTDLANDIGDETDLTEKKQETGFNEIRNQEETKVRVEVPEEVVNKDSSLKLSRNKSSSKIYKKSSHERTLEAKYIPDEKVAGATAEYSNDVEESPLESYNREEVDDQEISESQDDLEETEDWESNNWVMYMMTHKDDHFLYELWMAYYFCIFANGWFLLPLVVYYFLSGEFYFKTKIIDSIKYNLKYYFVMLVIMLVVLLILIFKQQNLKDVFRVSLSVYNSVLYAVFLVSMAHGMARLPVKYFNSKTVQQTYAHQVKTFMSKKRRYTESVLSMNKFYFILQTMDEVTIDKFDREKRIIYEIFEQVKLVELEYAERQQLRNDRHLSTSIFHLKNFVNLHYEIIKLNYQLQMHRAYVFENLKKVLRFNRLCHRLYDSPIHFREPEFKDLNVESLVKKPCLFRCMPSMERPYYTKLRPCSEMSLCIFLSLSSLFVLIVETCGCFMEKHILNIVKQIGNSPVGIMLIIYFIAYLSFCAYYFFFRFNVFGVVGIKRGKKSNVYSLFYSTSMFVYLTYPICVNVFHLFIGEENTCFEQALGKQELATIGKVSLFTLAPFVILAVVLLTFFNVFGRVLQKLGIGVENLEENQLTSDDLETLQEKLNEEVLEILEDYNEYQHARHRLGRSQNLIDRFI
jgi:hypothetical protein